MKRKPHGAATEPVIDKNLLERAKEAAHSGDVAKPKIQAKCVVCGSAAAPNTSEQLCWVCRRLKISAWRDSDQPAAQE